MNILLQAIDRLGKDVEYYAVDLSLPELERTFGQIPTGKRLPFRNILGMMPCHARVASVLIVIRFDVARVCMDLH